MRQLTSLDPQKIPWDKFAWFIHDKKSGTFVLKPSVTHAEQDPHNPNLINVCFQGSQKTYHYSRHNVKGARAYRCDSSSVFIVGPKSSYGSYDLSFLEHCLLVEDPEKPGGVALYDLGPKTPQDISHKAFYVMAKDPYPITSPSFPLKPSESPLFVRSKEGESPRYNPVLEDPDNTFVIEALGRDRQRRIFIRGRGTKRFFYFDSGDLFRAAKMHQLQLASNDPLWVHNPQEVIPKRCLANNTYTEVMWLDLEPLCRTSSETFYIGRLKGADGSWSPWAQDTGLVKQVCVTPNQTASGIFTKAGLLSSLITSDDAVVLETLPKGGPKRYFLWTNKAKVALPEFLYSEPDAWGVALKTFDPASKRHLSYLLEVQGAIRGPEPRQDTEEGKRAHRLWEVPYRYVEELCLTEDHNKRASCKAFVDTRNKKRRLDSLAREPLVIYPFRSNLSQMEAVKTALSEDISLISGPPGTGKTASILNILANIVYQGKSVLVVSPNNSATDNVAEKLEEENLGWLLARLGNDENVKAFEKDGQEWRRPEEASSWRLSPKSRQEAQIICRSCEGALKKLYDLRVRMAHYAKRLSDLELQHRLFLERVQMESDSIAPVVCRNRTHTAHLIDLRNALLDQQEQGRTRPSILLKLVARVCLGIGHWNDYKEFSQEFYISLEHTIFVRKRHDIQEAQETLSSKIAALEAKTYGGFPLEQTMEHFSKALLFDALLTHGTERSAWREGLGAFRDWKQVRAQWPIHTSTCHSAWKTQGKGRVPYDYVICDESSQANLVVGYLTLAAGTKAVVVGDTKQIPFVFGTEEQKLLRQANPTPPLDTFDFCAHSFLSWLKAEGLHSETLLKEHYRCHPDIINFCNERYYHGQLVAMGDWSRPYGPPLSFVTSEKDFNLSRKTAGGVRNLIQAQEAVNIAEMLGENHTVGIETPYRLQQEEIIRLAREYGDKEDREVLTVHKYQGREREAMVFSTVVDNSNGFVEDRHLINVAVSRAEKLLYVLASEQMLAQDGEIKALYDYICYREGSVSKMAAKPAFPLIYPTRRPEHDAFIALRANGKADFYTELRLSDCLQEAIDKAEAPLLASRGVPLAHIIDVETLDLTDRERSFFFAGSHLDFLVVRSLDCTPVFAIEVDGNSHRLDPKQIERDGVKDAILAKANLPLIRIPTDDSEEHMRSILEKMVRRYCPAQHLSETAFADDKSPWADRA